MIVLSLVERGWQAARECSLDVEGAGVTVIHIVKGRLSRSIRAMFAPRPHIRIISMPRNLFWLVTGLLFIGVSLAGRLRVVLVDNDRSYRRLGGWVRFLGFQQGLDVWIPVNLLMVQEGPEGYELWAGREQISRSSWYEALGIHEARPDF